MNVHNFHYWCRENPSETHESSVHSVKEAGWCGVTSSDVIQTHILGEEQLDTATVNAKRYPDTLENLWLLTGAANARETYGSTRLPHTIHTKFL